MFTELSLGCWSSGHRKLYMCPVSSSTVSFFFSYMHIYTCPLYNVLLEVVCCCFPRNELFKLVGSICLPSFMIVTATVSEVCELNQNKKKKEKNSKLDYFQFKTFPGHIIYPFFNQRYLLSTCMSFEVPYTTN